jgi:hypothetical protein
MYMHKFKRRCAAYLAFVQFNSQNRYCSPYGDSDTVTTSYSLLRISKEMVMYLRNPKIHYLVHIRPVTPSEMRSRSSAKLEFRSLYC